MYDDILVATDGSDLAAAAATAGIELACVLEAQVHAVAVVEDGLEDNAARRKRRKRDAETIAERASDAGCSVDAVVRAGRPATEIRSYAEAADVDAIVLGTHGRSGIQRAVLGSVTLEVIREASRPVLSIGPDATDAAGESIDDVWLATDGRSGARAATDHALELADACDTALHALYAVDADDPHIAEAFTEHGEQTIDDVTARADERDLEATGTVAEGPAHEVVLEHVAGSARTSEDADGASTGLLVVGTEGKSTLERLVVGSTSQRLVANAPVPVLTVRTVEEP
ncbi:universal stress protein [Natrarchaeobaculum aegyptiacum]|uniref:Universal stress protein UspA n=1 Tax=Natrarchaeobaculum aegyptiacum TaxID=745377 RepID=A0A2Z2HUL2_9EURY|nr:universal stress protein [Natrarchaeobaculum aegyptiacum]ARS90986.1 universal stress protein UspA [Natrarchaeobaculum aegyptiacum]